VTRLLQGLIRLYQILLSPLLGPTCRYRPTCSHYALGALERHGSVTGAGLAILRVIRCNPWHPGGADPVP
jgi:putative membrane protein insertion efficiency factor